MATQRGPLEEACDRFAAAMQSGDMNRIVATHEELIAQYYKDVRNQASRSFGAAFIVAIVGFAVLAGSLLYLFKTGEGSGGAINIGTIGTASGILVEVISSVHFWL